ncbi:hypothetical protein BC830DRAFT_1092823 [Chytriomyces sp. MP71]|nr:hypothetical protein BC830DRAFT_1092823 [Chytriomyces sp. MP71]
MESQPPTIASLSQFINRPLSAIPAASLPQHHRIVPEGGMMTMDFRPDRVNIVVSGTDQIVKSITQG